MASEMYQVRVQDKMFGPFSFHQLTQLRDRGQLHPMYEVSQDGIKWEPASTLPGMFQSNTPRTEVSPWDLPQQELSHSGLGIASFCLAILMDLCLVGVFVLTIVLVMQHNGQVPNDPEDEPALGAIALGLI